LHEHRSQTVSGCAAAGMSDQVNSMYMRNNYADCHQIAPARVGEHCGLNSCVMQAKAQMDEEISRLLAELETARAEAKQHVSRAASTETASSQHAKVLAMQKQEHEAEKEQLQAEASSVSRKLAAAEASLVEAQQQEATLRKSLAEEASAQLDEELTRQKQGHEAEKQQLQAEATSLSSKLAAAEASLAEAQQQEATRRKSLADEASSQRKEDLARQKQEYEAEKQQLQAEGLSLGSKLAAAEASLTEAQQLEAVLREAAAKHDGDNEQGAERHALLEVSAISAYILM